MQKILCILTDAHPQREGSEIVYRDEGLGTKDEKQILPLVNRRFFNITPRQPA